MEFVRSGAVSKVNQGNPESSHVPATDAGASGAGYLRLPHSVIVRAPDPLPMMHRPADLAVDLGLFLRQREARLAFALLCSTGIGGAAC